MKNFIYRCSKRFFLTAEITKKIEARMEILYPSTRNSIINRTAESLIRIYLLAGITAIGMLWFSEISIYYMMLSGMVIYAVVNAKIYGELEKLELKLLGQLEKFVSDVKFRFQFDGMLEEAIQDGINEAEYEMSIQGERLLECLKNDYKKEQEDYAEIAPDNYFLSFYSICLMVLRYGDKKIGEESLFIRNLGHLKEDLHIEQLKRRKLHSEFMGLAGLTILPVFAMKPIEMWAISNIPEIQSVYEGIQGSIMTLLIGIITIGIYKMIQILKRSNHKEFYKNQAITDIVNKEWLSRMILYWIIKKRKKSEKINRLLIEVGYPYVLTEYIFLKWRNAVLTFGAAFFVLCSLKMNIWIIFLLSMLSGGIGYSFIYAGLLLKKQVLIMEREEEIVRFQTIILMIMHIDRMTVKEILQKMEMFAVSFKKNIYDLSNQWSYKGFQAFYEEKGKTGFHPYEKLLDSFIACDSMPIWKAFGDVEADRNYYVEKHKQENEELIQKKALIGKTIAFLPLCLVILLKLIVPFVVQGLDALYGSSQLF